MSLQYKLLLILATTFFFVLNYRERIVEPIHTMAIWNKCFFGNFLFRFIIIWFYARVNGFSVFLHPFDIHFHVSIMPFPSPLRLFQMKNDPSICWVKNRWNDFGVFFLGGEQIELFLEKLHLNLKKISSKHHLIAWKYPIQ